MKIKIRSWESMARKFGVDSDGDIDGVFGFPSSAEKCLPEDRVIDVDEDGFWRIGATRGYWIPNSAIEKNLTQENVKER